MYLDMEQCDCLKKKTKSLRASLYKDKILAHDELLNFSKKKHILLLYFYCVKISDFQVFLTSQS